MTRTLRGLLLAGTLVVATLAAYAPVFSAGFVDVDDADYVPENDMVKRGLTRDGVAWAFGGAHAGNWFPITWISHMADVEAFGVAPRGHHGVNLALHVANALLVFGVLASITGALAPSFAAAALFALHPVQVESVAWISQRKTTLSTLFGLAAVAGYARWARTGARGAYLASLAAFALSLLAKQTLVTMPFLLALLDRWPLRRPVGRRPLADKVPYAVLAVAAGVVTIAAQGDAIATGATFPLGVRLGNAVIAYVRYLAAFVWPANLSVFYPLFEEAVTPLAVAASAALLAALTGAALAVRRARPWIPVGWLFYLLALAPVIGVVQVGSQAMADRYAYLPFLGLEMAVTFTVWTAVAARPALRAAAAAGFALVCTALGAATYRQAEAWHDSIALFEDAAADVAGNYVAHRALAAQYFNAGEYARALRHAEEGAKHPRDPGEILPTLGMALYQTGAKAAAIAKLEEATRVAPESVMGYTNLGWVYLQEGDAARAREVLARGAAVDPASARALRLLATSEVALGRLDAAGATLARYTAVQPLDFDARIERARIEAQSGRIAAAAAVLADALAAAEGFPADRRPQLVATLRRYRGEALAAQGDRAGAAAEYERAMAARPEDYAAYVSLAELLLTSDVPRAVALAEEACARSARRRPDALATLAAAYGAAGRRVDAERTAREALDRAREVGDPAVLEAIAARVRPYAAGAP